MKKLSVLLLLLVAISCGKTEHDLTVKGTVKGLKKGTIYLQKISDTTLLAVDSVSIKGDSNFELHSTLESPEMFYLYLDKNDNTKNRLSFFADKGITEINTTLNSFVYDAKIKGSKQQEVLSEYNKMIKQFNNKSLDLYKARFEAQQGKNTSKFDSLENVLNKYDNSRFKYSLNFSMNHLNSEVTPYIVLTELYNANIKALDTIYNNLDEKVLISKYGLELKKFIEDVKLKEAEE